jgi:hypothetical protein
MEFYADLHKSGIDAPNEAEFQAYYILTHLRNPEIPLTAQRLPEHVFSSPQVSHALRLYELAQRANEGRRPGRNTVRPPNSIASLNAFSRFFKLVACDKTSFLAAALVQTHFSDVRVGAVKALKKAYLANHATLPIGDIVNMLGFDDEHKAGESLKAFGIDVRPSEDGQPPAVHLYKYKDRSQEPPFQGASFWGIAATYPLCCLTRRACCTEFPSELPTHKSRRLVEPKRHGASFADLIDGKVSAPVPVPAFSAPHVPKSTAAQPRPFSFATPSPSAAPPTVPFPTPQPSAFSFKAAPTRPAVQLTPSSTPVSQPSITPTPSPFAKLNHQARPFVPRASPPTPKPESELSHAAPSAPPRSFVAAPPPIRAFADHEATASPRTQPKPGPSISPKATTTRKVSLPMPQVRRSTMPLTDALWRRLVDDVMEPFSRRVAVDTLAEQHHEIEQARKALRDDTLSEAAESLAEELVNAFVDSSVNKVVADLYRERCLCRNLLVLMREVTEERRLRKTEKRLRQEAFDASARYIGGSGRRATSASVPPDNFMAFDLALPVDGAPGVDELQAAAITKVSPDYSSQYGLYKDADTSGGDRPKRREVRFGPKVPLPESSRSVSTVSGGAVVYQTSRHGTHWSLSSRWLRRKARSGIVTSLAWLRIKLQYGWCRTHRRPFIWSIRVAFQRYCDEYPAPDEFRGLCLTTPCSLSVTPDWLFSISPSTVPQRTRTGGLEHFLFILCQIAQVTLCLFIDCRSTRLGDV